MTRPARIETAITAELLAQMQHDRVNHTEMFARLQSNLTNDVLASGLQQFDASGQITDSFRAPFGSVAVANHGTATVTLTNSPPASAAPQKGKGIHRIPAGGFKLANLAGTAYTLYGTASEFVTVEVFTKAWPPAAAVVPGSSGIAALVAGGSSDADAAANAVANELLTGAHGYVYNGTTWDRMRALGSAGDGLGVALVSQPLSTPFADTAAGNTAVVRTFNAVAGQRHRLTTVSCSFSGVAATIGLLTVVDGATTIAAWDVPLTLNTPFVGSFPEPGIPGSVNTNMVITLAAGGVGAIGKLNTSRVTT